MSDNENGTSKVNGSAMIGLIIIFGAGYLAWDNYAGSNAGGDLYYCEHKIDQCKRVTGGFDCLFTNTSEARVEPERAMKIWNYDENGVLIDTTVLASDFNVPPGQTIHVRFHPNWNAKSSVACSVNPTGGVISREDWMPIKK